MLLKIKNHIQEHFKEKPYIQLKQIEKSKIYIEIIKQIKKKR